jgi:hypothetical protein
MADAPSKQDLIDRAEALGIDTSGTKEDLARRIGDEEARRGIEPQTWVPGDQAPTAEPVEAAAVADTAQAAPASPDSPTDGRPPLHEVAADRVASTYVRVIGDAKEA